MSAEPLERLNIQSSSHKCLADVQLYAIHLIIAFFSWILASLVFMKLNFFVDLTYFYYEIITRVSFWENKG